MRKRTLVIILLVIGILPDCFAADAVKFLISIHQNDRDNNEKVLVYSDSTTVVKNIDASAFLTGFALDIDLTDLDSQRVEFNVHIVTVGPFGQTIAKRFKAEYGLPATISDIKVKDNSFYSLTLVPQSKFEINSRDCAYNHNSEGQFVFTPSANMDFYNLPSSLANYHVLSIRNLFEAEYRLFREAFHFNMTSKQSLYLFPCEGNSVIWDRRFGTSVDPTRNTAFTIYNSDINTADPFVIIHGAIIRSYGYAPPFLTEGLAGYFSMAVHSMKSIVRNSKVLPLETLLNTHDYLTADAGIADATAASFVKYLVDKYTFEKFRLLYEQSDDINLISKIESVYSKPVDLLEAEWLNYINSVTIPDKYYGEFALRSEQMFNYSLMLEYSKEFAERAATRADSILRLDELARAYFFNGDYYHATTTQQKLVELDSSNADHWLGLATFKMMNGYDPEANADIVKAHSLDSNDVVIQFNLALNLLRLGDTAKAAQFLMGITHSSGGGQLLGESRVMLGNILRKSKELEDRQQAQDDYTVALSVFAQHSQTSPASPGPYMWSGIALTGLNDPENALDQLQLALFLESRPFYIGMINLWLGKTADLQQKRSKARDYYGQVISVESSAYHQREARQLLDKPYMK